MFSFKEKVSCDLLVHRHRRDREPSRITEKRLKCIFYISRERRKLSGTYLVNNVPRSSTFHRITRRSLARKHKYRSYLRYAFQSKHVVCKAFSKAWMNVKTEVNAKCKLNLIQKSGIPATIYERMFFFHFLRNETYLF